MTRIPPLFVLALLVQALEGTACAHKPAPSRAEESPPSAPAAAPSTGRSEFTFLADPSVSPPKVTEDQELIPPFPMGRLVPAIYPGAALAAGAAPASVGLRIVIGDDGLVADVGDSPIARTTPSPFAAEFRKAAEIAVKRWRFAPGHIDQYEDGLDVDDDGPRTRETSCAPTVSASSTTSGSTSRSWPEKGASVRAPIRAEAGSERLYDSRPIQPAISRGREAAGGCIRAGERTACFPYLCSGALPQSCSRRLSRPQPNRYDL